MSKRLTQYMRDKIARRAVEAAFEAPMKALAQDEDALARDAWNEIVPPAERDALATTPTRFLSRERGLALKHEGMCFLLTFAGEPPPAPQDKKRYEVSRAIFERAQALDARRRQVKEAHDRARAAVEALVGSATTLRKLCEVWPEGEPFYADIEPPTPQLPAVDARSVNAMLGLAEQPEEAA